VQSLPSVNQGCQIFPCTIYQNRKEHVKSPQNMPNRRKCTKLPQNTPNIPTFFIPRLSKIYPNWDFWYENVPSGNPAVNNT
jgi:hypothetical protein